LPTGNNYSGKEQGLISHHKEYLQDEPPFLQCVKKRKEPMKPWSWRSAILKSELPSTTRHVLLTLSCYVNEVGQSAYPSTKTLADDTGLSERAVITHLHVAEESGWLKIKQHGFSGQGWARHEYYPSTPSGLFDTEGAEYRSAPSEKALNVATEGTEPHAEGTERHDKKALNDVQSNNPYKPSIEQSIEHKPPSKSAKRFSALDELITLEVEEQSAEDWLTIRKAKKAPLTLTALEKMQKQAKLAGITLNDAVGICIERGWAAFNAEWVQPKQGARSGVNAQGHRTGDNQAAYELLFGKKSSEVIDV
jgi:hypothetical protein